MQILRDVGLGEAGQREIADKIGELDKRLWEGMDDFHRGLVQGENKKELALGVKPK